jgi:hypothetical protein
LTQFDKAKSMIRNLPPKWTAGFGPTIRQFVQPAAAPAGQYQGNRLARQLECLLCQPFSYPL